MVSYGLQGYHSLNYRFVKFLYELFKLSKFEILGSQSKTFLDKDVSK